MNKTKSLAQRLNFRFVLSDSVRAELKDKKVSKLRVKIEATHSGIINGNKWFYSPRGMESGADSFIEPYRKPLLLNHDKMEDAIGRVLKSAYVSYDDYDTDVNDFSDASKMHESVNEWINSKEFNSKTYKGLGHIELEVEISDQNAIEKVIDGRYSTVSISGDTDKAICSTCGVDLKTLDNPHTHEHQRGEVYDGELNFLIGGVMDFREVSFVNVPADKHATATEILKDSHPSSRNDIVIQDSVSCEILDYEIMGDKVPMKLKDLLADAGACSTMVGEVLDALGLTTLSVSDEEVAKMRKTSFLFGDEKLIPIKNKAYVLVASKILSDADDIEDYADAQAIIAGKMKRLFGSDTSFDDALEALIKEEVKDAEDVKDNTATGSSVISDEVIDSIVEKVALKLKELVSLDDSSSYSVDRVNMLETEIEALEDENTSLSKTLKSNVVHQILLVEDKCEDTEYKTMLVKRSLESLSDKLSDLTIGAADSASEGLDEDVNIDDASSDKGDVSDADNSDADNSDAKDTKVLSVSDIRANYRKVMKEDGLSAASKYLKQLNDDSKLPEDFRLSK